jgi:hypothetical protein
VKAFLPAVVLAPFVAAAAVRVWQARRHVRARERWILWVPIGGSVVVGFRSQLSSGRSALVLLGAAAASYLTVAVLALIVAAATGESRGVSRYVVSAVSPGSAAAGRFAPGDRIEALDGVPLRFEEGPQLSVRVQQAGERPIRFDVLRGGRPVAVDVTPRPTTEGVLRLGIELAFEDIRERRGPATTLGHALGLPARRAGRYLAALWDNATTAPEKRADFMGPVGITDMLIKIEGPGRAFDAGLLASIYFLVWAELVDLVLLAAIGLSALRRARS